MLLSCFFFSSRRRHTRWNCDWSSDVCSSDLAPGRGLDNPEPAQLTPCKIWWNDDSFQLFHIGASSCGVYGNPRGLAEALERSEERRVGKGCRSRWAPEQEKRRRSAVLIVQGV